MSVTVASLMFAGVGMLFAGLAVPLIQNRVPPNRFYGFRTPKTLSDPKIWYEVNRVSGVDILLAGALITISSFTMLIVGQNWRREYVVFTLLLVMILSLTGAALHGYSVSRRL